tara:strand:+ start:594 stop:1085 length:492 start_codon:yes stop_codon:yes gene_type:complete
MAQPVWLFLSDEACLYSQVILNGEHIMKKLIANKLAIATWSSTGSEQQDEYLYQKRAESSCYATYNRLTYLKNKIIEQIDAGQVTYAEMTDTIIQIVQAEHEADQSVHEQLTGETWTPARKGSRAKTTHLSVDEIQALRDKYSTPNEDGTSTARPQLAGKISK